MKGHLSSSKFIPRADHVGSLLRPQTVASARKAYFESQTISAEQLKEAEDAAILDLIAMQQEVGLKVATDGEARRSFWHYDYMGALDGLDLEERDEGVQFAGIKLRPIHPVISGKLDFPANHPMLSHYRYLADNCAIIPKISIPGPSCCHFRIASTDIHYAPYQDVEVMMDDLI